MVIARRLGPGLGVLVLLLVAFAGARSATPVAQAAPANDNFANAIAITTPTAPGVVAAGDSTGATTEAGEATALTGCTGLFPNPTTGATIWYNWTSPGTGGTAVLDLWGTGFDTILAVYTGGAFPLTPVTCNDDNTVAAGTLSALSFSYVASTTYRIQVGGFGSATGTVVLNMSLGAAIYADIGSLEINQADTHIAVVEAQLLASGGTGASGLNRALQAGEAARVLNAGAAGSGSGDLIHFNQLTFPASAPAQVTTSGQYETLSGNNDTMSGVGAGVIVDGGGTNFYDCITITGSGNHVEGIQVRNCSGTNSRGMVIAGSSNVIGGVLIPAQRNLIYQNFRGLAISGSGNQVIGNYIGTDPGGTVARPNTEAVFVNGSTNTIGGALPGEGNLISGNGDFAVKLTGPGNVVRGNVIGLNAPLSAPLPNGTGIYVQGANNTVGGVLAGQANKIANSSAAAGVTVNGAAATGDTIRGNSVYSNNGGGIDNQTGGNLELAPPIISSFGASQVKGIACAGCTVDVYNDSGSQGRFYLGATAADGGGVFVFTVSGYTLGYMTATATDAGGNTSEFSGAFVAPPNADGDGLPDASDPCPTQPEDYDGFQDSDGCPDPDNDQDGICDPGMTAVSCHGSDQGKTCFDPAHTLPCDASTIDCRNMAEDYDGFKDGDGCPDPDNDNDGFPDPADKCPGADSGAGADGMLGSPQDLNHNGVQDGGEALLTTDDVPPLYAWEDKDGVLDTDGCHDSPGEDFDGDGYTDDNEALHIGTDPGYPCGIGGWPSNVFDVGMSGNKLDVQDIVSFVSPVRHLDKSPPNADYSARWDLSPGPAPFTNYINIVDITTLLNAVTGNPPMFSDTRAFGKVCPLPP